MRRSFLPGYQGRGLTLADWQKWLQTDTGVLTLIWYVRFGILLWLSFFYLVEDLHGVAIDHNQDYHERMRIGESRDETHGNGSKE